MRKNNLRPTRGPSFLEFTRRMVASSLSVRIAVAAVSIGFLGVLITVLQTALSGSGP